MDAYFLRARFEGNVDFARATFREAAQFVAAHAERGFTLAGARFGKAPDFIQAHFSEAPRLDNIVIPEIGGIARFLFPVLPGIVADSEASALYRALKRLAIQAHDHIREHEYFASEMKALRGFRDTPIPCLLNLVLKDEQGRRPPIWPGGLRGTARYWAGFFYEVLSNFGRSMIRPLVWWLIATGALARAYLVNAIGAGKGCFIGSGEQWVAAVNLSIRKALPFAGVASANKLDQIYACLYGIHGGGPTMRELPERFTPVIPDLVDYLGILQFVFSLVLIFLFLLAVRNNFRIR